MIKYTERSGGVVIPVKVVPGASNNSIVGPENDELKIRLNAPPLEGRANVALIKFLSVIFDIRRSEVVIIAGQASRHKKIWLKISVPDLLSKFGSWGVK